MKLFLTSTGLENPNLKPIFISMLPKSVENAKILLITTAAFYDGAKAMIPKCYHELINVGFGEDNIELYNFEYELSYENLILYDAVGVCGGSTRHLVCEFSGRGFDGILNKAITNGLLYYGISAGSIAVCNNYDAGLHLVDNFMIVHSENQGKQEMVGGGGPLYLDNRQALLVNGEEMRILS